MKAFEVEWRKVRIRYGVIELDHGQKIEMSSPLVHLVRGGTNHFILSWRGPTIPTGVKVGNTVIACFWEGIVTNSEGRDCGRYLPFAYHSGPDRDKHTVILAI